MSNKKRRLSPPASSRSSSTPAPSVQPHPAFLPNSSLSSIPLSAASPTPDAQAGPSRHGSVGAGNTPIPPSTTTAFTDRDIARPGTVVIGSGDGVSCGDECFLWTDLPMNKGGYRYAPCGPSPNPSPHPHFPFYRTVRAPEPSPPVHLSWLDRSAFLRLSIDAMTASADRGFRSARANVSVREGSWYYEVRIERGAGASGAGGGTGGDAGNAHVRVGWGRREALLDAPVGLDGYSYAIRDVAGEKVHLSRSKPYGRSFGTGDVVGCLITLPPRPNQVEGGKDVVPDDPARIKRKRVPLRWKGQMYFESEEYTPAKEMEAKVDREGKLAKAEAEAARLNGLNGHGSNALNQADEENQKPSGAKTKGKKGATTKNIKKDKDKHALEDKDVTRVPTTLLGSSVSFFLNGEPLGKAFTDLYDFPPLPPLHLLSLAKKHEPGKEVLHDDGTLGYYPMISCFGRGKVRCNFGPEWWFKPPEPPEGEGPSMRPRPMCERWDEYRIEEKAQDEKDEEELGALLIKQLKEDEKRKEVAAARLAAATQGRKAAKAKVVKKKKGSETPRSTPAATPAPDVEAGQDYRGDGDSTPITEAGNQRRGTSPLKHENGDATPVKIEMDSRVGTATPRSSRATSPVGLDQDEKKVVLDPGNSEEVAGQPDEEDEAVEWN